jgi:mono/diheme cytochrome c family protein
MFKSLRSRYVVFDLVPVFYPSKMNWPMGANRSLLLIFAALSLLFVANGCRRATPPAFTPAPEVVALTADIEDPEELKEYKDLQVQIAEQLLHLTGTPDKPIPLDELADSDRLRQGFALYSRFCVQCHGTNGDGNGIAAAYLQPKPRNYTHGIFKFTSTPYGMKPRRADLIRTIRRGITGTSMPTFDRFSNEDIDALVDYVIYLSQRGQLERQLAQIAYDDGEMPDDEYMKDVIGEVVQPWHDSSNQIVMPKSPMPPMTEDTVKAGHQLFLQNACNKCHGKFGRGGSMEKVDVGVDAWGNTAAAADLSSGMFRGGERPIDIYRRISSGINGTPMPAFEKLFQDNPEAIWQLVHFIRATGERRRQGKPPLSEADLPTAPANDTPAAEPTDETPPADQEQETEPAAQAA